MRKVELKEGKEKERKESRMRGTHLEIYRKDFKVDLRLGEKWEAKKSREKQEKEKMKWIGMEDERKRDKEK